MTPANPPSLAPRAIETRLDTVAPPSPPRPSASTAVIAKLAALVAEARAGDADFVRIDESGTSALSTVRNTLAGSEAWIDAELVRSALQVARQRSADALGAVDTLTVEQLQATSDGPAADALNEIDAARGVIETIVNRQTARLDALMR